jgi:hypothetical protein
MKIAQRHAHMNSIKKTETTLGPASSDTGSRLFVVPTQVGVVTEFSGRKSAYKHGNVLEKRRTWV